MYYLIIHQKVYRKQINNTDKLTLNEEEIYY